MLANTKHDYVIDIMMIMMNDCGDDDGGDNSVIFKCLRSPSMTTLDTSR